MTSLLDLILGVVAFIALPVTAWRLTRGVVPLAVLPILVGLALAIAGAHAGQPLLRGSEAGELAGWAGVLLLAYVAGLEAAAGASERPLRTHARRWFGRLVTCTAIALALPFFAGFAIAELWLLDLPAWSPPKGDRLAAAAAIGLCLAVSALPVLVAIVRELPADARILGALALRIAALSDAVLWLGLSGLLIAVNATVWTGTLGLRDLGAIVVLILLLLCRYVPRHLGQRIGAPVAWLVAGLFLVGGSWGTATLGLHALVGAYLAGMVTPAAALRCLPVDRLGFFAMAALAPLFFGYRGLAIDGGVLTWQALAAALGLLAVSAIAKICAIVAVPPGSGLSRRDTLALGALLQCKGLMEIVAATVLRDHGVLTDTAYAVLIGLAVLSTTVTKPLFGWVRGRPLASPAVSPYIERHHGGSRHSG